MLEKIIDYDTGKIDNNIIYDIILSIKHWYKNPTNQTLSIYGYEDNQFKIKEVDECLGILKKFKYVRYYRTIDNNVFEWGNNKLKLDLSKEISEYNTKVPTLKKRKPKFFIFIDENKWKYLDHIYYKRGLIIDNNEDLKILIHGIKKVKNDLNLFKDFLYGVSIKDRDYISYINKVDKKYKLNYIEDTIYFLYYQNSKIINFIKNEILKGGIVKSITIEKGSIFGYRGKIKEPILTLSPLEKKLVKYIKNNPMGKSNIMNITKQKDGSFKKLKSNLRKKIKDKGIDHLFKIEYTHRTGFYVIKIN